MNTNIIVAITQGVYEKGKDVYERGTEKGLICIPVPADETGLAAAVKEQGAKHAVIGITNYADALYEALPGGGVLARFGVGYDNINLARATEKGLLCTNTPGVLEDSVAEM
ncbi:MAG: hypothetical protein HOC71_00530, partial [Candidatus Latescibacteria bacterium]|nr:hypothetical protein [Candidatus Latescibacterota bacterium]